MFLIKGKDIVFPKKKKGILYIKACALNSIWLVETLQLIFLFFFLIPQTKQTKHQFYC